MVEAAPRPPAGSLSTHRSLHIQARTRFSFKLRRKFSRPAPEKSTPEERRVFGVFIPSLQQHTRDSIETSTPVEVRSPLIASLLPLSFAQRRRDIRERREGFETSGNPPTPFAIRAQTLLPLDVAYGREDIRRRHERFESPKAALRTSILPPLARADTVEFGSSHSPNRTTRQSAVLSTSASHPGHFRATESTPSVYSLSRSRIDISIADLSCRAEESWSYDSLVAAYSSENSCSDDCSDDAGGVRRILENLTSSSFDEESFIRMAEDHLGW